MDDAVSRQELQNHSIEELTQQLAASQSRLSESESSRVSLQEELDNCRRLYESELNSMKTKLQVIEEDYNVVKQELASTKTMLASARDELGVAQHAAAQSQLAGNSRVMTMQDIARRREESLANYRRQYELQHPNHHEQAAQMRAVYQTDSSHALDEYGPDGFDEIDG